MFDLRLRDDRLELVGEVLEDDDRLRAGVSELNEHLVRGIEGVGVDHDAAGAQRGEDRDRGLQQVRQLDGDAVSLLQPDMLEV